MGESPLIMDAKEYFAEIVQPTIADFESNPRSRRHAFLACVATFHTIDYISHPKKPRQSREAFRKESPEFATIERVAHAFKHVRTGNVLSQLPRPISSGQVMDRPPGVWGQAVWGLSRWDDATGGVTIAGEHDRDLLADVKAAEIFLKAKIGS